MNIPIILKSGANINIPNDSKNFTSSQSPLEESINKPNFNRDTDAVFISGAARNVSQEQKSLATRIERFQTAMKLLDNLNETTEGREDGFSERLKCIKIALRIIKGDKVPLKDMVFLAEKEPGMYSNAILLKENNENPKKHKSIIGDEDSKATSDSPSGSAESPTPEYVAEVSVTTEDIEVTVELET